MKTILRHLFFLVLFLMNAHLSLSAQSITGQTTVCPNTTVRYTFTPTGCSLVWGNVQGPGDVTVVAKAANYIDLQFPRSTSTASYRLNASYSCAGLPTPVGNATLDVTVKPSEQISSTSQVISCGFTGLQTFKMALVGPNQRVTWTTNTGWPVATPPTIYPDRFDLYFYEIGYNVNNFNSGSVKISVAGTCSNAVDIEHTYNITRSPSNNLPAPVFTARPSSQCVLTTNTFAVQTYADAISYTWNADLPTTKINGQTPPVTISAANNGHTVTITDPNTDYVSNISVTSQTTCGNTLPATYKLRIGYPLGTITLSGPDEVPAGATPINYFLQSNPTGFLSNVQSVDWFEIPVGWTISHYLNNNTGIQVAAGSKPGYIQLYVKACNVTRGLSKYISIGSGGPIPPFAPLTVNEATAKLNVSVYPNPATNSLNLVIPEQMRLNAKTAASKDKLEVTIFDINGVMQYRERIAATRNTHTIDVSRLLPGAYTIQVLSGTKQGTAKFIHQ